MKKIKKLEKKHVIAKYFIGTLSGKNKEWKRIMINGEKTDYEMNKEGTLRDRITKEIYIPHQISDPPSYCYYNINLSNKHIMLSRHRLLAALFIPIPKVYREKGYNQENLVINHKDGVKGHDDLDNLEWCTVKENMNHAIKHGLITYLGENSHLSTITDLEATEICELLAEGKRPKEVSEITGIRERVVRHIYNGECWKQLTENYEFPETEGPIPYSYSDDIIRNTCELIQEGKLNNREISEITGVNERYISDIKNKKRRVDVSDEYDFSNAPPRNASREIVARQICEMLQEGKKSVKEISEITGLGGSMISGIKCGRYWTNISKDYDFSNVPYDKHNDDDKVNTVKEICNLLQENTLTHKEIANKLGVFSALVDNISKGRTWKSISKDYTFPDTRKPAEKDENLHRACFLFSEGESDNKISKDTGITRGFLRKLRRREVRTDISSQYNF